jgi:general secretion pathway protein E
VAVRNGMTTMIDDGLAKCRAGITSAAEILRVTSVR